MKEIRGKGGVGRGGGTEDSWTYYLFYLIFY